MTIAIVLILVVGLGLTVVIAVARDPGPTPVDVAVGYARALATRDFDAMYRMTDEAVLQGHNRPMWIAEQEARPHAAIDGTVVDARSSVVTGDTARVVVAVDAAGGSAAVALALRQRIWVVESFTPLNDGQL